MDRALTAARKKGGEGAVDAERKRLEARRAADRGRGAKTFYRLTVKDNGVGMAHAAIPDLLGRVLSGTKYGVCQTRGKFGLGAKMALIWSKMSTGLPIEVRSARRGSPTISYYKLDIDIHRNEPAVHAVRLDPNPEPRWRGSELSVTILGDWKYYRSKVKKREWRERVESVEREKRERKNPHALIINHISLSLSHPFLQILAYLRQIAVITPYAQFSCTFTSEDPKASLALRFARRTDIMPPCPQEVKHHPASVDLELVKRLLADTGAPSMASFLAREFSCISKAHAARLASEIRAGVAPDTAPSSLDNKQAVRLHQLLHEARFPDPPGDHLSPAGEYNLRLGIAKELSPDLVATHQCEARALEGHAFVVEAAVSLGGSAIKPGLNIYRFANRIPLLFEGGSDVITKTALKRINWAAYKINASTDRVGVFVSVVSTRIPYKGAGKEYISDDMAGMVSAVRAALQGCCAQLKVKIARAQAAREQKQRRKNLTKYVPAAAGAVYSVLAAMADRPGGGGPKRRRLEAGAPGLLPGVASGETTADTLAARLNEYVERVDTDLALEYQMQQVKERERGGGERREGVEVGVHAARDRARGAGLFASFLMPPLSLPPSLPLSLPLPPILTGPRCRRGPGRGLPGPRLRGGLVRARPGRHLLRRAPGEAGVRMESVCLSVWCVCVCVCMCVTPLCAHARARVFNMPSLQRRREVACVFTAAAAAAAR